MELKGSFTHQLPASQRTCPSFPLSLLSGLVSLACLCLVLSSALENRDKKNILFGVLFPKGFRAQLETQTYT